VDGRTFLGLEQATDDRLHWRLPVEPHVCTSGGFLFGGCGLAASIAALEGAARRPLVWATAQYLSYAAPGEVLDIDVTLAVAGRQTTQARAVGHVGDREIFTVNAAFGDRPGLPSGQFESMPEVPPPSAFPDRVHRSVGRGWINDQLEQRIVKGREVEHRDGTLSDGNAVMWARIPEVIDGVDAATLAILGDFVPMALGMALGIEGGGNSLDNTLRVLRLVPTEWVLLDITVHGAERGFGHGLVHMFAEDGTLMATASQSCIIRYWK
jgi:acyl-CoA thioesterase-2